MIKTWQRFAGASFVALAAAAPGWSQTAPVAAAQVAPADADSGADGETIIVTGTRRTGLRAVDSPAPIEILDSGTLERVGKPDLISALAANIPSFTTQGFGGDASNLKLSARLRGLSPNHALILVNGKRRHGAASLTVSATGGFSGAASPDLSFIPVSAIDHVEVLTDGAAAQYGSDAIAGVINIILKKGYQGGQLSASGGAYGAGDGETVAASANAGFGSEKAWLNLTAEYRSHDYSDRGGPDQRLFTPANLANTTLPLLPDYPYVNKIFGDARYQLALLSYNAGIDLGNDVEVYSTGTSGFRYASSRQNYRFPSIAPTLWPKGFTPRIVTRDHDYQFTGGVRGNIGGVWHWDLSTTWGANYDEQFTFDSANTSLIAATGTSPTDFFVGEFVARQWTSNLDISRELDVGLSQPLNIAVGGEYRRDTFVLKAGDAAGRFGTSIQAYPAFGLTEAGSHARDAKSVYGDLSLAPIEHLQLDLAGRYERYSDFGSTAIGKVTARYDLTPAFGVRGTFSTGFRAPTLAEEYYSATNVSPTTAGVKLPPNAPAARLLGIAPLDAEKSTNISLGAVFKPSSRFNATLDAYQIAIDGRILATGTIFGLRNGTLASSAVTAAIIANGNNLDPTIRTTTITTFVNGADTRTLGIELVLNYNTPIGGASVDWSLGGNYNKTTVRKIVPASAQIAASGQKYLDLTALSYIETASPRFKLVLGALVKDGKWLINLRNTLYGKSSYLYNGGNTANDADYLKNVVKTTVITDLEISYNLTRSLRLTAGANNLFDILPDKINPISYAASITPAVGGNGVATRQSFGPYGINGGYYYGRVTFTF